MVGVSLPTGYNLRTHVLLFSSLEGCASVITHTSHCIQDHVNDQERLHLCCQRTAGAIRN